MKRLESKIKEASAKWRKRRKYRAEFIKRNPEFQKLKKEVMAEVPNIRLSGPFKPFPKKPIQILHKNITMEKFAGWSKILELGKRLFPDDAAKGASMIIQFAIQDMPEDLEEIVAQEDLPTLSGIEVVLSAGNEIIGTHPVEYFESDIFRLSAKNKSLRRWIADGHCTSKDRKATPPQAYIAETGEDVDMDEYEIDEYDAEEIAKWRRKEHIKQLLKTGNTLALDGVDEKERTVLVKIRLDRNKEDLQEDLKYLLDLLEWEAKELHAYLSTSEPFKPQWDVYDKCIDAWEFRKQGKTYPEIAKLILPKYFAGANANPENAINLVKHYKRKAEKMINGGWRRI